MRRAVLSALLLLALCVPAAATNLLNVTVTTAVAAQTSTPVQFRDGATSLVIQGRLVYGSGGTSADAWVQTSVDGGTTWIDIANFHFLLVSAATVYNLSAGTAVTTGYTPTDGSLAANTAKDGIIGTLLRVKYTTVGTYAGGTKLIVDVRSSGSSLTAQ